MRYIFYHMVVLAIRSEVNPSFPLESMLKNYNVGILSTVRMEKVTLQSSCHVKSTWRILDSFNHMPAQAPAVYVCACKCYDN